MMGRAAYQEPWLLLSRRSAALRRSRRRSPSADAAADALDALYRARLAEGARLHSITRHMLGLFQAVPGARAFRRHLATEAVKPGACAAGSGRGAGAGAWTGRPKAPHSSSGLISLASRPRPRRRLGDPACSASRSAIWPCLPSPSSSAASSPASSRAFSASAAARSSCLSLRGFPRAGGARRGAHAALRRHLARDHRSDDAALFPGAPTLGQFAAGGHEALGAAGHHRHSRGRGRRRLRAGMGFPAGLRRLRLRRRHSRSFSA